MAGTLRSATIHLAASLPQGSSTRRALLDVLAAGKPSPSDKTKAKKLFDKLRDYDGDDMDLDSDGIAELWDNFLAGETTLAEIRENLPAGFRE